MTFRLSTAFFFLLTPLFVHSQWINEDLFVVPEIIQSDSNKFTIEAEAIGFFKNNEYFSPIAKGETLPGVRFTPKIGYQVGSQFKIQMGFTGIYYSGDQQKKGIEIANSVFARFQYAITPNLNLTLGNYYGGANHRLIEPLYKWEQHFTSKPESGIQLMYDNKKIFADVWVDWRRFIQWGDTVPELLTFGFSSSAILTPDGSPFELAVPLQVVINHSGGQIDKSDEKMIVAGNFAAGICSKFHIQDHFIQNIGFSLYGVGYYDKLPDKTLRPYDSGFGVYPVLSVESKKLKFMCGYWNAKKFYSFDGEPLFNSFNLHHPGELQKTRSLLNAKFSYSHIIHKNVSLGAQFETYSDLKRGETDYAFGVHLRFDGRIY